MTRSKTLILNVDDDQAGRYAVGRNLRQAGYEVIDAETGVDGLRLVSERKPDLVLLDVRLPDIDGFEVCRLIRQQPAELGLTPVVQLSASYLDTNSKVKGLSIGADAYLTEPVEPPILVATIESVLRIRRAEQELRRSALQWQITFNAIRDGVALFDRNGSVVRSNDAYRNLIGCDSPRIESAIRADIEAAREAGSRRTLEITAASRTLAITLDPVAGHDFDGVACVVSDVTESKRFQEELRETAKLESLGVLAGGIAHDFNNLLTGIIGSTGLLREMFAAHTEERELADEIMKAGESAADLTRQILAYAGRSRFVMGPVNLSLLALEMRELLRRFIPRTVELVYDTDPNLPPIQGDSSQIQQIVMNIIINAGESFAESRRGIIQVTTKTVELDEGFFEKSENVAPGRYVLFSVSDNGSGMTEETQRRIFEPFFTTKFVGRGLGLSAVHGILRSHNGYIRLESAVGKGTTFRVYLPLSQVEQPAPRPVHFVADGIRQGTVLFVDDEASIRKIAKTALEKRGYQVLLAEDGEAAVELVRQFANTIDVVILDYAMPVMNGEQAFGRIREISASVPVVLSSGFSQSVAADKFLGKGLAGFLGKPYSVGDLVRIVEEARTTPAAENG